MMPGVNIVRIEDIRQGSTAALFIGREHGANVSFFVVTISFLITVLSRSR
jgi:hypothetical protein